MPTSQVSRHTARSGLRLRAMLWLPLVLLIMSFVPAHSTVTATDAALSTAEVTPLIFIPGVMGSYLDEVDADGDRTNRWPLGLGKDRLSLNPADPTYNIIATDVIRDPVPLMSSDDVYQPLLAMLTDPARGGYREYDVAGQPARRTTSGCDVAGQRTNQPTLFVFAYDWRKSNSENAARIAEYVGCIQRFYPDTRVNILAHSMGGILARRYILDYPGQVEKLITVATPWLGAPQSLAALETGQNGFLPFMITDSQFKDLSEFFPSAHELLPSRSYFNLGGRPFYEDGWDIDGDGRTRESYTYDQLIPLLDRRYPRSTPGTTGATFHDWDGQDNWTSDQSDVEYYHIVGIRKLDDTLGSIYSVIRVRCSILGIFNCKPHQEFDTTRPAAMVRGDQTVPLLSAARVQNGVTDIPCTPGGIPGAGFNAPGSIIYPICSQSTDRAELERAEHTGLVKNPEVHARLRVILGSSPAQLQAVTGQDAEPLPPADAAYYLRLSGTEAVTITDAAGVSTQAVSPNNNLQQELPEVTTYRLGADAHLVVLPLRQNYTITFPVGTDPLALELTAGDGTTKTRAIRYQDLTFPTGGTARLDITPLDVADLQFDGDGDGQFETSIAPTIAVDGNRANDLLPPTLTGSSSGPTSGVTVTLTATDSGVGVQAVYYSLDGDTYQRYTGPIQVDVVQTPVLYAFADDNLANRSSLYTLRLVQPVYLPLVQR